MGVYTSWPIWKDFDANFGAVDSADFRITVGNAAGSTTRLVYSGTAHRKPGESVLKVRINDICANHMSSDYYTFRVLDSDGTAKEVVGMLWDWSYEQRNPMSVFSDKFFTAPITRMCASNQLLMLTVFTLPQVWDIKVRIYGADGNVVTVDVETKTETELLEAYGFGFALPVGGTRVRNYALNVGDYPDALRVEFFLDDLWSLSYEVDRECYSHVLYYINAYGGWDSLLLRGRMGRETGIKRSTYGRPYDNKVATERGTVNYLNELTHNLMLRTGWLTDEGASHIDHLLGSTNVYLRDLSTGSMTPLVINETSVAHKTFRGEGAALVSYEISATEAQKGMRL